MGRAFLEVRRDQGVEIVELVGDAPQIVGRDRANAIAFPADPAISRRHAVLEPVDSGWLLRDIGSSNGTFVNGARLDGEHALAPGDAVELGDQRIVFRLETEAPTEQHAVAEAAPAAHGLDLSEEWSGGGSAAAPAPADAVADPEPLAAAPASSPPVAPPASPASRPLRRGAAHIRGTARSIHIRESNDKPSVLAFRVDRFDASGNRIEPVGVELNYYRSGQISEGDEVEVTGSWSDGTVRASKIVNLSTGAAVKGLSPTVKLILVIAFAAFCLFFLFIILSMIAGFLLVG